MRNFFLVTLCLLAGHTALGQEKDKPTNSFVISGDVKSPVTINIDDLKNWRAASIGGVVITNHLGERKSEAKELKGVLLKDILGRVEINAETPRMLSEYYFVCKANDGYTVVYSWNELFNTVTGDSAYIITEKEGQPASAMKESILMISPKDFRTGRRHVKALVSIDVRRAQ
jgi:hypothetical protein